MANKARVAAAANKIKDLTRAGVKIRGGSALTQAGMASADYRAKLPASSKASPIGGALRGTSGNTSAAHAAGLKAAEDIARNPSNFRGSGVDTSGVRKKK